MEGVAGPGKSVIPRPGRNPLGFLGLEGSSSTSFRNMSIERDCNGAGIFLEPDVICGGGVHGSGEVKVEMEWDFLTGEGA